MAYYTGETVHVTPVQHFQPQYGYPQASLQQHSWPPLYFQAHSHQEPAVANTKDSYQTYSQRPNTQTPPQIQPDPLPPHSKPQDLSPNQSRAFAGPMPCKPIHLGKDDVFYKDSCTPLLAISKEAVHMPSFLSSKPLLTITRCDTNARLGTIRFHMTSSDIELNVNGRDLVLSSSRLHNRWTFQPTSPPNSTEKSPQSWYWRREKLRSRSVILVDAKKRGHTMARIDGNILSFERVNLGNETLDEIIMTAVALAEHARRHKKNAEIVDLSSSIADLAGGHGTSHSGSSHHHHGGHPSGGGGGLFFGGPLGGDGGGGSHGGCGDGGGGGGGGGGGDGGGGGGGC